MEEVCKERRFGVQQQEQLGAVRERLLIHISTRNEKSQEANGRESLLLPSYYLTNIKQKKVH